MRSMDGKKHTELTSAGTVSAGPVLDWAAAGLLLFTVGHGLHGVNLHVLDVAASLCLSSGCLLVIFGSGTEASVRLVRCLQASGMLLFLAASLDELQPPELAAFAECLPKFW